MKTDKIVAIVGATGAQGGGLARAILGDPARAFAVRAVTRLPASAPAQALAAGGADIVAADLDRVETLKRAFDGAYAVFCVTNFWEHGSPDRECAQASSMAEAARRANMVLRPPSGKLGAAPWFNTRSAPCSECSSPPHSCC